MLVNIRETLERVVEVDSINDAEKKYSNSEIILNAEDLKSIEIEEYMPERTEDAYTK